MSLWSRLLSVRKLLEMIPLFTFLWHCSKDPDHLERYSHPAKCRYGSDCYKYVEGRIFSLKFYFRSFIYSNDPDHRKQFAHSTKDTSRTVRSEKPRCRYNEGCTKYVECSIDSNHISDVCLLFSKAIRS